MKRALHVAVALAIGAAALRATEAAAQEGAVVTSVRDYAVQLRQVERALRARSFDEARLLAAPLQSAVVEAGGVRVPADSWLLAQIAAGRPTQAPLLAERVAATARALEAVGDTSGRAADPALLARLRAAQTPRHRLEAGEAGALPPPSAFFESLITRLRRVIETLGDWMAELWRKLFREKTGSEPVSATPLAVGALVTAVVLALALVAVRWARGRRRAPAPELVSQLVSDRDDDPLSRETEEWETVARQLASAGRFREAIRASYHAVLVALFRTGRLQYEKGRTNWEYAARVPLQAAWKTPFFDLTRRFDREWYGSEGSSAEAWQACVAESRRVMGVIRGGAPA